MYYFQSRSHKMPIALQFHGNSLVVHYGNRACALWAEPCERAGQRLSVHVGRVVSYAPDDGPAFLRPLADRVFPCMLDFVRAALEIAEAPDEGVTASGKPCTSRDIRASMSSDRVQPDKAYHAVCAKAARLLAA